MSNGSVRPFTGDVQSPVNGAAEGELLRAVGVGKTFGGAVALEGVDLELSVGTVLGIVGENGAGKSTLMKILAGVYPHGTYQGVVYLRGEEKRFRSVQAARSDGVVLIPQELHIAPELSIAENMFAGVLPTRNAFVDTAALAERARQWLSLFELDVDPLRRAAALPPSAQRLALIAGALSQQARVLILDEPTAALSHGESRTLFRHLARLRDRGIGILFISHRLDDLAQICDRILVMRNGRRVAFFDRGDAPRAEIVTAMIGRAESAAASSAKAVPGGAPLLEVAGLRVADVLDPARLRVEDVSFDLHPGEVLGLFGLVGAGRTEIARAIFGAWPGRVTGDIRIAGSGYLPKDPGHAIRNKLALLTEDRKQSGIFAGHSIVYNIDSASAGKVSRYGFFSSTRDLDRARGIARRLDIRATSVMQAIESLSGGNQQKVMLGRWLAAEARVVLLDEPTVGVDIGAREEIYRQIEAIADAGCAVLLISSDLDEVVRMCSRTLVMYKGRISGQFEGRLDRHELMLAATGGR